MRKCPACGAGLELDPPADVETMTEPELLDPSIPGADLVRRGLEDLRNGRESTEALVVSIGRPRLVRLGLDVPPTRPDPEHRLYRRLAAEDGRRAHARYNALIRRLVSFERTIECAM